MNIKELSEIITKLRKYNVKLEDPFAFISELNKNQINNIKSFIPNCNYNPGHNTDSIRYSNVLSNLDLLNYHKFNEVVGLIFLKLNKHFDYYGSIFPNGEIKKILECKIAFDYDTVYNDIAMIERKLERLISNNEEKHYNPSELEFHKFNYIFMSELATNEISIKGKTHNLAMELICNSTDYIVADSIRKIETSDLNINDRVKSKALIVVSQKTAPSAEIIAKFILNKAARNSENFIFDLKLMEEAKNVATVEALYNVGINKRVQESENHKFIMESISKCEPAYAQFLKTLCFDSTCLDGEDFKTKIRIIMNSRNEKEADKNTKILLNKTNEYDEMDVILYNAMIYVDENGNDESLDIPAEVLTMTKPKQVNTNNTNDSNE